jgi:hypothetical protein
MMLSRASPVGGLGHTTCMRLLRLIADNGTVALSVDIITVREIFRLAVAPSAQAAVLSD